MTSFLIIISSLSLLLMRDTLALFPCDTSTSYEILLDSGTKVSGLINELLLLARQANGNVFRLRAQGGVLFIGPEEVRLLVCRSPLVLAPVYSDNDKARDPNLCPNPVWKLFMKL